MNPIRRRNDCRISREEEVLSSLEEIGDYIMGFEEWVGFPKKDWI